MEPSTKVVLVCGRMGTGKDALGDMLQTSFRMGHVCRIGFSDEVRRITAQAFNVTEEFVDANKHVLFREAMQAIGHGMRVIHDFDYWPRVVDNKIRNWGKKLPPRNPGIRKLAQKVILTGGRYAADERMVRDKWNGYVVKMTRDSAVESGHASEVAVDEIEPDFVLENNGTLEDLQEVVHHNLLPKLNEHFYG